MALLIYCYLQVLDMSSANSPHWRELMGKKRQVEGLSASLASVLRAAFGLDQPAAAAVARALAAEGASGTTAAAAACEVAAAGRTAIAPEALEGLLRDAQALVDDMPYWDEPIALKAWLLLRAGKLEAAATASAALSSEQQSWGQRPAGSCDWRWWLQCQVKWHKGDLAAAQELLQEGLQKLDSRTAAAASSSSSCLSMALLPSRSEVQQMLEDLKQLLDLKSAGNTAVTGKKYEQAVEHYTKALALQPSAGYAALLHSNRAAALQSLDRLAEALADCGRAIALDPSYGKAYSRCACLRTCTILCTVSAMVGVGIHRMRSPAGAL